MDLINKENKSKFFEEQNELIIEFNGDFEGFNDFQEVFDSFYKIDIIYTKILAEIYKTDILVKYKRRTKVKSVSKESPLIIHAFIENHWYDTLLFIISLWIQRNQDLLNRRNARIDEVANEKQIVLSEAILEKLDKLTFGSEFDNHEIERIMKWYISLSKTEKSRFDKKLKKASKVMGKVQKIQKRKLK